MLVCSLLFKQCWLVDEDSHRLSCQLCCAVAARSTTHRPIKAKNWPTTGYPNGTTKKSVDLRNGIYIYTLIYTHLKIIDNAVRTLIPSNHTYVFKVLDTSLSIVEQSLQTARAPPPLRGSEAPVRLQHLTIQAVGSPGDRRGHRLSGQKCFSWGVSLQPTTIGILCDNIPYTYIFTYIQ